MFDYFSQIERNVLNKCADEDLWYNALYQGDFDAINAFVEDANEFELSQLEIKDFWEFIMIKLLDIMTWLRDSTQITTLFKTQEPTEDFKDTWATLFGREFEIGDLKYLRNYFLYRCVSLGYY